MSQLITRLISVFLLLSTISVASAQDANRGLQLETARELIQMGREEMIRTEIRLSDEEAEAFWPVYDEYRAELAVIQDRYITLVVDYVADYYDYKLTQEDAERILEEYFEIENDILKIREKYVRKFKRVMTPGNVMRLYQLENKIEAEVNIALAQTVPLMEAE